MCDIIILFDVLLYLTSSLSMILYLLLDHMECVNKLKL